MKTIAIENGLDSVVSKPAEMGGNRIDQLGAAAGGIIIALHALLQEMPRFGSCRSGRTCAFLPWTS